MAASLKMKGSLPKMKFDAFLEWSEGQEGKWELHGGIPVRLHDPAKMHSERARHARAKMEIMLALKIAVAKQGLNCEVFPDGMSVRIDDDHGYEPDAVVSCGKRLDGDDLVVSNPVIIVEVLSPSTAYKDIGDKLLDYFSLESVQHYLVVNPVTKSIQHFFRQEDGKTGEQTLASGQLVLTPPSVAFSVEEIFS